MEPPHSIDAEQSVIGALVRDNDAWPDVAGVVTPSDFYHPQHQIIYEAMAALARDNQPIDTVTLANALEARKLLEQVGGRVYVAWLHENTLGTPNSMAYARIVRENAQMREALKVAQRLAEAAYDPSSTPDTVAALMQQSMSKWLSGLRKGDVLTRYDDLPDIPEVDWIVKDLIYRAGIYLFVGAPKTGKTTAMRTLAATMATDGGDFIGRKAIGTPVAYVDFENPAPLAKAKWDALANSEKLPNLWLALGARAFGDPMRTIELAARQLDGLGILFVDGLSAILPSGEQSSDGGYTKMGEVIGTLRTIADRHNCAVVAQHHAPWDAKRPLGSTAIAGQVDGTLHFSHTDEKYKVETLFMRDGKDINEKLAQSKTTGAVVLPVKGERDQAKSDAEGYDAEGLDRGSVV